MYIYTMTASGMCATKLASLLLCPMSCSIIPDACCLSFLMIVHSEDESVTLCRKFEVGLRGLMKRDIEARLWKVMVGIFLRH